MLFCNTVALFSCVAFFLSILSNILNHKGEITTVKDLES